MAKLKKILKSVAGGVSVSACGGNTTSNETETSSDSQESSNDKIKSKLLKLNNNKTNEILLEMPKNFSNWQESGLFVNNIAHDLTVQVREQINFSTNKKVFSRKELNKIVINLDNIYNLSKNCPFSAFDLMPTINTYFGAATIAKTNNLLKIEIGINDDEYNYSPVWITNININLNVISKTTTYEKLIVGQWKDIIEQEYLSKLNAGKSFFIEKEELIVAANKLTEKNSKNLYEKAFLPIFNEIFNNNFWQRDNSINLRGLSQLLGLTVDILSNEEFVNYQFIDFKTNNKYKLLDFQKQLLLALQDKDPSSVFEFNINISLKNDPNTNYTFPIIIY